MKIDIKTDKTRETIEVTITLDSYNSSNKNKIKILTRDVDKILKERNITFTECVKYDGICNINNDLVGKWIYSTEGKKGVDTRAKPVVSSNKAKRSKRNSKPADE